MPKLIDRAPKLRRHATGQGVVTLGGRDHYCGRFGSPECRERYRRFVQEWFATGCTLPPGQPAREQLLVKQVIAGYWQHAKTYYRRADGSATSTLWILKCVLRTLRRSHGNLPAAEFGPRRLHALRDEWVRAGNCRTTCNAYVGHVVRCFRWAVANELVSGEIYQALRALDGLRAGRSNAVEGKGVGTVHPWAVRKVLRHVSPTVRVMILFQWRTGCRPHEVCELRFDRIERDRPVWVYRPVTHKTAHHGHERMILIGPRAQRMLRNFATPSADSSYVFNPQLAETARRAERHKRRVTAFSCGNRPGSNRKRKPKRVPREHYSSGSYARAIRRACIVAGIIPFSPNQLRHNAATRIRGRHGLEAAQIILGHRHARITEVYAERDLKAATSVATRSG